MRIPLTALTLSYAALLSAGCPGSSAKDIGDLIDTGDGTEAVDADGDGFAEEEDCDDDNAEVNPDAEELCDGIDNNCDDVIDTDATDLASFYADGDGDTYGNADDSVAACADAVPSGYVADNTDCDDAAAEVNPAADEVCNDIDDNCDSDIDEDTATDASSWFADTDTDTFGDPAVEVSACAQPDGYVADNTDCDDTLSDVNTDGTEVCDSIDNDCDDTVDEDDATDALTWYADGDSDTYGDAAATTLACSAPSGYVADATDCDDTDGAVNPAATETCDTLDNDCDGTVDEDDAADAGTFYVDGDGDGFGDASSPVTACYASAGGSLTDTDTSAPAAAIDANNTQLSDSITLAGCGTLVSVSVTTDISHAYRGDLEISLTSPAGTNVVLANSSWDSAADFVGVWADTGGDFTPVQALSGFAGEDSTGAWTLNVTDTYPSMDDGTWNSWDITAFCGQVTVADNTDCDDAVAMTYPGADEYCNAVDDDCDNIVDEADSIDASDWYEDSDQDGYGDPGQAAVTACYANGFYTAENADDCNDSVATTNPGADEYCNGADDDCDTVTDEDDAVDATGWIVDTDGDGYGTGTVTTQCDAPGATYVALGGDCDETDADINPGAYEHCDGIDSDCDGAEATDQVDWYDTNGFWSDGTAAWTGGTAASPLTVAPGDGKAVFCPGTYYVTVDLSSDVELVGGTGDAADVILDGGGTDRVLDVTAAVTVDLENLTVANGYAQKGANVRCDFSGAALSTDNVLITGGSHVSGYGSGIYAKACDLGLGNTQITGNSAMYGGGIYLINGNMNASESTIDSNTSSSHGGGIRIWADAGTWYINLVDTWVTNNDAGSADGGGIAARAQSGVDIFIDCETTTGTSGGFYGNSAGEGGGVHLDGASSSGAEADLEFFSGSGCDFGDSGGANDNSPDDIFVEDASTAYYLGDGSAEGGREFDCDSGGSTNGCSFSDLSTDGLGITGWDYSNALSRAKGNIVLVDNDYEISNFSQYLALGSNCDVDFYVLESATPSVLSSDWTEVASTSLSFTSSASAAWVDSGYLGDVSLVSGNYYAFLVGWDCGSYTSYDYFYSGSSHSAFASDLGTFSGVISNNSIGAWESASFSFSSTGWVYPTSVQYN